MTSIVALAFVLCGCRCAFDDGKLDELSCSFDEDCRADHTCVNGLCAQNRCSVPSDCGADHEFRCEDGFCVLIDSCAWPEACLDAASHDSGDPSQDGGRDAKPADGGVDADAGVACLAQGEPCDDRDPCTTDDTCEDGQCIGTALPCDDDDACTTDSCQDGECSHSPVQCNDGLDCTTERCDPDRGCVIGVLEGHCAVDATCFTDGDRNPQNPCQVCVPAEDDESWTADDAYVPSDGVYCTEDECREGLPIHDPRDSRCPDDSMICAACGGGCVPEPDVNVSCSERQAPGEEATCTISIGAIRESACLSCTSSIGITSVVRETFDDCDDLDGTGWVLDGTWPTCTTLDSLPPDIGHVEPALELSADMTMTMSPIDTTGHDQVRLCYDLADDEMSFLDEFRVEFDTGAGWQEAGRVIGGPIAGIDRNWLTICADLDELDPAAAGNENLGIRFMTTISSGRVFLDNVSLEVWDSDYVSFPPALFLDSFDGCELAEWENVGTVDCSLEHGDELGREALEAQGRSWRIIRTVDASTLCDDLWVGFAHGTNGTNSDDSTTLGVDHNDGSFLAWGSFRRTSAGDTMQSIETRLSVYEPGIRFEPDLELWFQQDASSGMSLFLDDISLRGAECASGEGVATIGEVLEQGLGLYTVAVSSEVPTTAHVACTFAGRRDLVGRAVAAFRPEE